jgi:hypothetical protein
MGQVGREAEFSGPIQNLQSGLAGMVVCAVMCEPVSAGFSLRTGNFLKNSANNRLFSG